MENYISEGLRSQVATFEKEAINRLAKLQKVVKAQGEGLEDLRQYEEKGVYWKIDKVVQDCESWMLEHKMPPYLRNDYLQRAKNSIPESKRTYYEYLAAYFPFRFGNTLQSPTVSFVNDIEEVDGIWLIKKAYINAKLDEGRRYLNAREKDDFKAFTALLRRSQDMEGRGYNVIELLNGLWNISPEGIAETLTCRYNPNKDRRAGKEKN